MSFISYFPWTRLILFHIFLFSQSAGKMFLDNHRQRACASCYITNEYCVYFVLVFWSSCLKKCACVAPDRFLICLTENTDDVKWKKKFHSKLSWVNNRVVQCMLGDYMLLYLRGVSLLSLLPSGPVRTPNYHPGLVQHETPAHFDFMEHLCVEYTLMLGHNSLAG